MHYLAIMKFIAYLMIFIANKQSQVTSVYLRPGSDCQVCARLTATYRSCLRSIKHLYRDVISYTAHTSHGGMAA